MQLPLPLQRPSATDQCERAQGNGHCGRGIGTAIARFAGALEPWRVVEHASKGVVVQARRAVACCTQRPKRTALRCAALRCTQAPARSSKAAPARLDAWVPAAVLVLVPSSKQARPAPHEPQTVGLLPTRAQSPPLAASFIRSIVHLPLPPNLSLLRVRQLARPRPSSLLRLKHHLLHLHLVEQIVALDRLGQRHDLVRHEPALVSSLSMIKPSRTHPSLSWCFFSDSSACGNTLRTGHLPICTRRFLLYAWFPVLHSLAQTPVSHACGTTHHGISPLCTPTLERTPHGRSSS